MTCQPLEGGGSGARNTAERLAMGKQEKELYLTLALELKLFSCLVFNRELHVSGNIALCRGRPEKRVGSASSSREQAHFVRNHLVSQFLCFADTTAFSSVLLNNFYFVVLGLSLLKGRGKKKMESKNFLS